MTDKLYKLMNWPEIETIVYSESDHPHELLGPHKTGNQILVQAFFPEAKSVRIQLLEDGKEDAVSSEVEMEMADEAGYFAVLLGCRKMPRYRYAVRYDGGELVTDGDPYRHEPLITTEDTEKFKNGIHYTIYEKLGAHPCTLDGEDGTYFAVWAPNAMRISVVGDFNHWDGRIHQMRRLWDSGIFEIFIPGARVGDNYKFELKLTGGLVYLKSDPYGNAAQLRPDTASVIADLRNFPWEDQEFVRNRVGFQTGNVPVSVYEMYLGSFVEPEEGACYANYRAIAPRVIEYVKKMGYTHVELMPVMEHPYDGSWGYQVIGYYAPTARYGKPEDFMYFVNELHKAGIGVILDWVPAHFPRDTYGLSNFDGTCLYEHKDPRQGFHPHWGTLIYNYGRPEVSNYLIANALFWVEKFHADGIRMDAVASMLYLDYGRQNGQWIPNMYGGNENLEAIEMIKHLNSIMKKRNPGALSIAEESTAFSMITGDLDRGGLGFDLKWNMGFMNDYLSYIKYDPYFRSHHHGELTFSMIYAYSEKFMLVFSHDEVVHGKATLIGKMPGDRPAKFANLRLSFAYMMTHPGKKLLFMGQDLGEFDEWNETRRVEWYLLDVPEHAGVARLVQDLNHLYRTHKALYELNDSSKGFRWVNCIAADKCYLSYLRNGTDPEDTLLVVANFAGVEQEIATGVPYEGKYKEIFNTDDEKYGGTGNVNSRIKRAEDKECDDKRLSITVKMAPLSLSILQFVPYTEEELEKVIEQRIRKNAIVRRAKNAGRKTKSAKEKADAITKEALANIESLQDKERQEKAKAAIARADQEKAEREAQEAAEAAEKAAEKKKKRKGKKDKE